MSVQFTFEGKEYDLVDPDEWTTLECLRLAELSGSTPAQLVQDFQNFGALGLHALAWLSLQRAGVDKAWNELDLPYFDTLKGMSGSPVEVSPDPSTASTPQRKPTRAGRTASRKRASTAASNKS